jgi:SAM-dependent methyltransferase
MNTSKISVFENGGDKGWLGQGTNWWFNPNFPHAYQIFNLDSFYQNDYFKNDHVDHAIVTKYADYILEYGRELSGRNVKTILEVGCGGGWFTEEFIKRKIDIFALEGSQSGFVKTRKRIGRNNNARVLQHDLRLPLHLNKQFDVAICTEVAEHIEPPFSSQLIQTLTDYSKIIWFSFEKPFTNDQHYHHSNEQPEKFWRNLFKFYNFEMLKLPGNVFTGTAGRGGYIFYHESLKVPPEMRQYIAASQNSTFNYTETNSGLYIRLKYKLARIFLGLSGKLGNLADKMLYKDLLL